MQAIEVKGRFDQDGKLVLEEQPSLKNKHVKLLILVEEDNERGFYDLSSKGLNNAYAEDEPGYDVSALKELNTLYEGR